MFILNAYFYVTDSNDNTLMRSLKSPRIPGPAGSVSNNCYLDYNGNDVDRRNIEIHDGHVDFYSANIVRSFKCLCNAYSILLFFTLCRRHGNHLFRSSF